MSTIVFTGYIFTQINAQVNLTVGASSLQTGAPGNVPNSLCWDTISGTATNVVPTTSIQVYLFQGGPASGLNTGFVLQDSQGNIVQYAYVPNADGTIVQSSGRTYFNIDTISFNTTTFNKTSYNVNNYTTANYTETLAGGSLAQYPGYITAESTISNKIGEYNGILVPQLITLTNNEQTNQAGLNYSITIEDAASGDNNNPFINGSIYINGQIGTEYINLLTNSEYFLGKVTFSTSVPLA
jgi:hypothetical protein